MPTPTGNIKGDYRATISRVPAKLDISLMREPRTISGVPNLKPLGGRVGRKAVPSLLGTVQQS